MRDWHKFTIRRLEKAKSVTDAVMIESCGLKDDWEYKCPLLWQDMAVTGDSNVRHCNTCDSKVYSCKSAEDLER